MSEVTQESYDPRPDWSKVMNAFIARVRQYVPGELGWIARQYDSDTKEWTDEYAFVIGDKSGCVHLEAARYASDQFVIQAATELLGYAPGSVQDLTRIKSNAEAAIRQIEETIAVDQRRLAWYKSQLEETNGKIAALNAQHTPAPSGER